MSSGNFLRQICFVLLVTSIIFCGCKKASVSYVQDTGMAKELVEAVSKSLDDLNDLIPTPFDNSLAAETFNGAMVLGEKTEDISSSNGNGLEWKKTNIGIRYNGFFNDNLTIGSGTGNYYYFYSRNWQGISNSSLMITIRYNLNSCEFRFTSAKKELWRGRVSIDYVTQDSLATQYKATVSFEDGKSFKINGVR
jgi:hypothetical protein